MENITPKKLQRLKVVDLKKKLTELGLPTNGLKADLIQRISSHYEYTNISTNEENSESEHTGDVTATSEEEVLNISIPPPVKSPGIADDKINILEIKEPSPIIINDDEKIEPDNTILKINRENQNIETKFDENVHVNKNDEKNMNVESKDKAILKIKESNEIIETKFEENIHVNQNDEKNMNFESKEDITDNSNIIKDTDEKPNENISNNVSSHIVKESFNNIQECGNTELLKSISPLMESNNAIEKEILEIKTEIPVTVASVEFSEESNSENTEDINEINSENVVESMPVKIEDNEMEIELAQQLKSAIEEDEMRKSRQFEKIEIPIELQPPTDRKETKNQKKKRRKKKAKLVKSIQETRRYENGILDNSKDGDIEVEYVEEKLPDDPNFFFFEHIFQKFKIRDEAKEKEDNKDKIQKLEHIPAKVRGLIDVEEDDDKKENEEPKMSKKKLKKLNRLSVAELKQLVQRPDVVEMYDVTARDPKLLVHLKACRNVVPVPRHWCFKRKYLQGKRGFEKPPFELPEFIKNTGIMQMREAVAEKEDAKTLKQKMRERIRPKMGKIDIDYQKLHDAFFRFQTKPQMSIHGDIYYEGKEFETRLKQKKPGNLSDDLRVSLGMPIGAGAEKIPPPWLIAMQRYGPPPSYPNLKIPGLNAPIPPECSFGYHAGGWGKPPVDEFGKPLYGDVFGNTYNDPRNQIIDEDDVDRTLWGEMESESEEEEEEEEEKSDDDEPKLPIDHTGLVTPGDAGLVTPSGTSTVPIGIETPASIELRKQKIEDTMDQGGDTPALYQVLPEKQARIGTSLMGSSHVYEIPPAVSGNPKPSVGGVDVALDPDELDMDSAAMQSKYERKLKEQHGGLQKEDLSDMVAEHAAKQAKKRKKQQEASGQSSKKYKFKF